MPACLQNVQIEIGREAEFDQCRHGDNRQNSDHDIQGGAAHVPVFEDDSRQQVRGGEREEVGAQGVDAGLKDFGGPRGDGRGDQEQKEDDVDGTDFEPQRFTAEGERQNDGV
jgi:hypothetical protein